MHTIHFAQVCAQFLIDAMFRAFVDKILILLTQSWQKTIRVEKLANLAIAFFDAQPITKHLRALRNERLEKADAIELFHWITLLGSLSAVHHFTRLGILHQRAHDHTALSVVRDGMHSQ